MGVSFERIFVIPPLVVLILLLVWTICTADSSPVYGNFSPIRARHHQSGYGIPSRYTSNRTTPNLTSRKDPAAWLGYDPSDINNKPFENLDEKGQAVQKGRALVCIMNQPASSSNPQSQWTDPDHLKEYGYSISWMEDYVIGSGDSGLETAFSQLGLSHSMADWVEVSAQHVSAKTVGGVRYEATYALFTNSLNLRDGAVVASNNYGPRYQSEQAGVEVGRVVPLGRWSDVFFLAREATVRNGRWGSGPGRDLEGARRRVEHVFRHNLVVGRTLNFLKRMTGKEYAGDLGEWPGQEYSIDDLQGLAILSSDNAKGVAWLLGQHKEQLGLKTVDRVNVFDCPKDLGDGDKGHRWCMYLHVSDVEQT